MRVPLVDLGWQHREIAAELREGLERLFESGAFILGPDVAAFEEEFARASGAEHCVGVGSGTDALEMILRSLDIGTGCEVILPANTFIASALAVARAGAKPVLVDSDLDTHLIDPAAAAERIGAQTRALLAVNLFGQIAPMEPLAAIARDAGISLVEDAAQSQGAQQQGRRSGSFGMAAGSSFYPAKNLGAYGDAGAVTTSSEEIATKIRQLRNYGSNRKYHHPEFGFNSRLDTLQALVLRAKLRRLESWNDARRRAAQRYDEMLADRDEVVTPCTLPGNEHVYHLYTVRVPQRDRVLESLRKDEIDAGIHYPVPVHLTGAFESLGHRRGDFPAAERAADELLSLPLFPGIREDQQVRVVESLGKALGG